MPISDYLRDLRQRVGHDLLLLPGVAGVVHDDQDRVLLVRRADNGRWDLPAGAVDPGEAPAQALVREVYEETGLAVVPERIVGVFGGPPLMRTTYPNGDQAEYTVTVFRCRVVGGELAMRDGEALELAFVALDDLADYGQRYPRAIYEAADSPPMYQWDEDWIPRAVGMKPALDTDSSRGSTG